VLALLSVICFVILASVSPLLYPHGISLNINNLPVNSYKIFYYYLIYNLFNAPSFLVEYLLLLKDKSRTIVVYGIVISVVQVLSLTLPVWLGFSLQTGILFLAASALLKFIFLSVYVFRIGTPKFSKSIIQTFGSKALPAVLTLIVGGSMPYIDSYIALLYVDKAKFAIYRYGAQEMPLVALMANALSNVFSGEIARAKLNGNIQTSFAKLKSSSARLMHGLFPVTITLIIFSRFLFEKVYSGAFIDSAAIFNVFLLLTISRLIFPQTILMGLMRNRTLLVFNSMEWIVNLVLDLPVSARVQTG
jgi:O-antigen/teichoic acid export membrane protein